MENRKKWGQFFTSVWAAELLFDEHFSHLTENDLVWEPSCGEGHCLSAIPKHIPAIGSEIDPLLVPKAQENTGRTVYHGDFRTVTFDRINQVTAMFGNPPFDCEVFEQFMKRCENILRLGDKAGFILPAYFFQTAATLMRFGKRWEISQQMIPRNLFKGEGTLSKPLIFATFVRDDFPLLHSFRLYKELLDINALSAEMKDIVTNQVKRNGSVWKEAVATAIKKSGGTATLSQLYQAMEGKRPTENPFWKEQIRKVVQQSPFQKVAEHTYQLS